MFALGGKEIGPGNDVGMLFEQRAPLTFGHASPDTELDAIVQRVSATLGDDRAVAADHRGLALSGPPNEELIGVRLTTPGLRNPCNTGFCLFARHNGLARRIYRGTTSRGLD